MGYARWSNLTPALNRAVASARNQGLDVDEVFLRSQKNPSEQGGRPRDAPATTDVTAVLGYANGRDALASLPERMRNTVAIPDGNRGNPNRAIVSEFGVYRLIMRSNLPSAERFQDWLAEEVIPSIRRTGSFGAPAPALPDLTTPQGVLALAEQFKQTAEQLVEADARIKELEPKALVHDMLLAAQEGDLLVRQAAKALGWPALRSPASDPVWTRCSALLQPWRRAVRVGRGRLQSGLQRAGRPPQAASSPQSELRWRAAQRRSCPCGTCSHPARPCDRHRDGRNRTGRLTAMVAVHPRWPAFSAAPRRRYASVPTCPRQRVRTGADP
ncbi:BRO-N domain-containing protein [Streptomyces sp. 7R007]